MGKILSKNDILKRKPTLKEIEVPQWGGSVNIRSMTVAEQARLAELGTEFEKASTKDRIKNITMQVIKWVVCDEQGAPLFTDEADVEALMGTEASAVMDLQKEIIAYSAASAEARKQLEKNLQSQDAAQNS